MFNKDKIKGFVAGVCVALVLSSSAVFADSISKTVTAVYNNIKIVIDGEKITPKDANGNVVEPFIIDGTTYLPVRAVASALGKEVNWDGNSNTVYLGKMPEKEFFQTDLDTFKPFAEKDLFSINSDSVKGGILNFYVVQNANHNNLSAYADNFSASGNLQTLTIDSKPAAKVFVESALEDLKLIYSACQEAEKTGYASQENVKKEVESNLKEFKSGFATDAEYKEFADSLGIPVALLEEFASKTILFNSYIDYYYNTALNKAIDTTAIENTIRSTYITAKHILVEDEILAKEIINKIEKGEDFDTLMKTYNTDPGATSAGYTFTKGEMVLPFETAAYALKENTYTTTPVKTDFGYHIIYRLPLDEKYIVNQAIPQYKSSKAQIELSEHMTNLKDTAQVIFTPDYEKYLTTIK